MSKFVKLTKKSGEAIVVNSDHVLYVQEIPEIPEAYYMSRSLSKRGTEIVFSVFNHDSGHLETATVTEGLSTILGYLS